MSGQQLRKRLTAATRAGHPPRASRLAGTLAAALALAAPPTTGAATLAEQMARAMTRMMETLSERRDDSARSSLNWPSAPQGWSGMPWGNPWNQWSTPYSAPGRMLERFPGQTPGWGTARSGELDGAWIGNTGIGLVIRGNRLRLLSDTERYRDMTLRFAGKHVWLYDQDSGTAKRYEYARAEDRMALRDEQGNTMLFKRWEPSRR